jgi:hypothetical protein
VKKLVGVFPDFPSTLVYPEIIPGDVKLAAMLAKAGSSQ